MLLLLSVIIASTFYYLFSNTAITDIFYCSGTHEMIANTYHKVYSAVLVSRNYSLISRFESLQNFCNLSIKISLWNDVFSAL